MSGFTPPAFDPDSPDAIILEAFENVRAHRAKVYAALERGATDEENAAFDAAEADQQREEGIIEEEFAHTPSGIFAQLAMSLVTVSDYWVDENLMRNGFRAIYARIYDLDGKDKPIAEAMNALLHLDWSSRLAAYRKGEDDLALVLMMKSKAEEGRFALQREGQPEPEWLTLLMSFADEAEQRFNTTGAIDALIRTLTPDHYALAQKVEVVAQTYSGEEAMPWIARDVLFVSGKAGAAA